MKLDEDTMEMGFEEDTHDQPATGELSQITDLVDAYESQSAEVERLEEALKEAKQQRDKLGGEDIPTAMDAVGLSEVRMADGRPVRVQSVVRASIRKDKREQAHQWLQDNGYGDLVKAELKVGVGRGELEELTTTANEIIAGHGWVPTVDEKVHPQTLSAFVRERREAGDEIPEDLLGVYEARQTKVG